MITPAQTRARIALAVAIALAALWIGQAFIPAILWACVVAIGVDPLTRRLDARLPGRPGLVASILTAAIALVVVVPLALAATRAVIEAQSLSLWLTNARTHGIPVPAWVAGLPVGSTQLTGWWSTHLATAAGAAEQMARIDTAVVIEQSKGIGHNLLARGIVFAFTMTVLWFLLHDRRSIAAQLERGAARAFGDAGPRLGRQAVSAVRGAVDGLVMLGLAQGLIMSMIYAIAGVPHPILLGMLSGLASMIPFGLVAVMLLALGLLIIKGAVVTAIVVGATGFAVNFAIDHFIRPVLIGAGTRLPFVWVLIGIVGGVETIGLLGLFVGPAVMAALVMIWREWVAEDHAHGEHAGTASE